MSALSQTGAGYPFVKFAKIGDGVAGRIISFEDKQETEFETDIKKGVSKGDLMFYPSGDPIMKTIIVLETVPGDKTSRVTLDCKGKLMMRAVAGAFRAVGRTDLRIGDDLSVNHCGMDGRAKDYEATYAANNDEAPAADEGYEDEPPF